MNKKIKHKYYLSAEIRKEIFFILAAAMCFALNLNLFAQDSTEIPLRDTLNTTIETTRSVDTTQLKKEAPIIAVYPDPALDPNSLDYQIFTSINYSRSSLKNAIVPVIDNSMVPMAILMPLFTFTYGRLTDKTYEENTGYLLGAAIITNTAITFATKMLVKRKRVRVYTISYGIYPKTFSDVDPYSFPSGHTSTSFAIATMLTLRYPSYPQIIIPAYLWAAMLGYGRIYLGMHYPSDVLAGAIIGAGSSILVHSLRKEFFKFKNNLLGEKKNDDGSINAGAVSIFAAGFLASVVFNELFPNTGTKLSMNASPFHNNDLGIGINLNYKF